MNPHGDAGMLSLGGSASWFSRLADSTESASFAERLDWAGHLSGKGVKPSLHAGIVKLTGCRGSKPPH